MVKNIIFDLGNVVLKYDNLAYLKSKIEDSDKIDKLREIVFRGPEWIMLDERGDRQRKQLLNKSVEITLS